MIVVLFDLAALGNDVKSNRYSRSIKLGAVCFNHTFGMARLTVKLEKIQYPKHSFLIDNYKEEFYLIVPVMTSLS